MEIFGLLLQLAITIYLVIDAPKHNKSAILWGILGFIFGFVALGIYLILTGRKLVGWIITIIATGLYVVIILLLIIGVAAFFSYAGFIFF
jgi:hypothetical protein